MRLTFNLWIFRIAYSLISIVGVVGNVAVFLVVTKSPQMRTLTNKFIGNLAVADLLVNVVCVPFTLVANLYPGMCLKFKCYSKSTSPSDCVDYPASTSSREYSKLPFPSGNANCSLSCVDLNLN